ncbi:MAG: hypothetical protein QMC96_04295 [Methanomicrobiales archaeon]|nr:hypothetical protein [Methanomicrobiales archaeon]
MDEAHKTVFKTKFIRLTLLLNLIVFCVAAAVIILFLFPSAVTLGISGLLGVAVILLSLYFLRSYRAAKIWLEEHA